MGRDRWACRTDGPAEIVSKLRSSGRESAPFFGILKESEPRDVGYPEEGGVKRSWRSVPTSIGFSSVACRKARLALGPQAGLASAMLSWELTPTRQPVQDGCAVLRLCGDLDGQVGSATRARRNNIVTEIEKVIDALTFN